MGILFLICALLLAPVQSATGAGVKVGGRVVPGGGPAQRVSMTGMSVVRSEEVAVGPNGTFEFLNVRPGSYRLVATPGAVATAQTVVVADKDIIELELVNPPTREVSGNVVVEGGGLRPNFTLSFAPYAGAPFSIPAIAVQSGTFKAALPEGEYRVSWAGIPSGYSVLALTAGAVDLLARPLLISGSSPPSITITLGVSSPPPWVRVRGRVTGLVSSPGLAPQVSLFGAVSISAAGVIAPESLQAPVRPDGTFEFPMVLPGNYTARLSSAQNASVPSVAVVVGKRDVEDVRFDVPLMNCVPGRVNVEGNGPIPSLTFTLSGAGPTTVATVFPDETGAFGVLLPQGERRIAVGGSLPQGYSVKSLAYGPTDLLRDPINISNNDTTALTVTFGAAPGSWVRVSGRVTGIDLSARQYYLVLMSGLRPPSFRLRNDGLFEFTNVLRGNYTLELRSTGGIPVTKTIAVQGQDLTGVEVAAPPQKEVRGRVEFEGGGRQFVSFSLTLTATGVTRFINASATPDGTLSIALPEGEYRVSLSGLPPNAVKSFTYGDADILKNSLRVSRSDSAELRLTLAAGTTTGVVGGVFSPGPNACTPGTSVR